MTERRASKSDQLYWLLQLAGWGIYALMRIIAAVSVLHLTWTLAIVEVTFLDGLGFGLTHLLRSYMRRRSWSELAIPQLALRILAAGFVLGTPLGIVTLYTHVGNLQDPDFAGLVLPAGALLRLSLQIVNCALLFVIWLVIYFIVVGVREYRSARLRQSELTRALQLAELRLLKSQLNPHFLFNALNTVRSLIADNPTRAQNAVTRLANTLRHSLRSRQDELVTVAQEMAIVEDYLELEAMRFEDRLRVETVLPSDAAGILVPVMLLQTLVENAIKHGIAELPRGGLVKVGASLQGDMLIVEVQNPRPAAPTVPSRAGVGLRNASDRLRLLFGTRAKVELDLSQTAVATARLFIPRTP